MKTFEEITKTIHNLLLKEGIENLSLKDIEQIINSRNNMLDIMQELDWIDFDLLDSETTDQSEHDFRELVYDYLLEECKYYDFAIDKELLEKIFRLENEILDNIGNIKSYYLMLLEYPDIEFSGEFEIDKWTEWKEKVDQAVYDFTLNYGIFPNILLANKHTLSQFNFLINNIPGEKNDVFRIDEVTNKEVPVDTSEEIELTGYECGNYHLFFGSNDKVEDKVFILEYNEDIDREDDDDDSGDDDNKTPVAPIPVESIEFN